MNPKVLKANNNYPFKTSERFHWYIAMENNEVVGFLPVEKKIGGFTINNYYMLDNNPEILKELLNAVSPRDYLYAIVQTRHEPIFAGCGFQIEFRWTNYVKMQYNPDEE